MFKACFIENHKSCNDIMDDELALNYCKHDFYKWKHICQTTHEEKEETAQLNKSKALLQNSIEPINAWFKEVVLESKSACQSCVKIHQTNPQVTGDLKSVTVASSRNNIKADNCLRIKLETDKLKIWNLQLEATKEERACSIILENKRKGANREDLKDPISVNLNGCYQVVFLFQGKSDLPIFEVKVKYDKEVDKVSVSENNIQCHTKGVISILRVVKNEYQPLCNTRNNFQRFVTVIHNILPRSDEFEFTTEFKLNDWKHSLNEWRQHHLNINAEKNATDLNWSKIKTLLQNSIEPINVQFKVVLESVSAFQSCVKIHQTNPQVTGDLKPVTVASSRNKIKEVIFILRLVKIEYQPLCNTGNNFQRFVTVNHNILPRSGFEFITEFKLYDCKYSFNEWRQHRLHKNAAYLNWWNKIKTLLQGLNAELKGKNNQIIAVNPDRHPNEFVYATWYCRVADAVNFKIIWINATLLDGFEAGESVVFPLYPSIWIGNFIPSASPLATCCCYPCTLAKKDELTIEIRSNGLNKGFYCHGDISDGNHEILYNFAILVLILLLLCFSTARTNSNSTIDKAKKIIIDETKAFTGIIIGNGHSLNKGRLTDANRPINVIQEYASEEKRLQTFRNFTQNCPIDRAQFAKNGFVAEGTGDKVYCFACLRQVEQWTLNDDPNDPKWHRQDCRFKRGIVRNIPLPQRQSPQNLQTQHNTRSGNAPFQAFPALPPRPAPDQTPSAFRLGVVRTAQHKRLLMSFDLNHELDRLASFAGYPSPTGNIAGKMPTELARNGFFYLGDADRTQCFSCGGIMRNWAREDNVHQEHATHFRRCKMVLGTETRNVYVPDTAFLPNLPLSSPQQRQRDFPCEYPNSPHMRSLQARVETFDGRWPHQPGDINASVKDICEAGFFYLGDNDRTKCWYCSGGLQHWEPFDEPWTEHAKWFPTCQFLLQSKGIEYVYRLLSRNAHLQRPYVVRQQPSETSYFDPNEGQDIPPSTEEEPVIPPPQIIDPQVEMKKRKEQIEMIMRESEIVKVVRNMGVDNKYIREVLESRMDESKPDYGNVQELLTAVFEKEEQMETSEKIPISAATMGEGDDMESEDLYSNPASTIPTSIANTVPKDPEMAKQALSVLEEERKCKVCLDRDADVVFLPCSHLCCCLECTQALRRCPLCREPIEKAIKVYTK